VRDALRERFLPVFLATARQRIARAHELAEVSNARALLSEMHALAGEAAVLELREVADHARETERAAKRWQDVDEPETRQACEQCLRALDGALRVLESVQ
jgi:HPt (histidine-containing phosphotransfer) domain-containing protein